MRQVHLGKPPWQRQNSCVVGLQHSTGRHCSNTGPACPPGHPPVRPGEVEAGNGGESVSPGLRRRDSGGRGRPAAGERQQNTVGGGERGGGHGAPPAAEQRPRAPQRPHGANAGRPQPRCPRRPRTPTRRSRGGARSPGAALRGPAPLPHPGRLPGWQRDDVTRRGRRVATATRRRRYGDAATHAPAVAAGPAARAARDGEARGRGAGDPSRHFGAASATQGRTRAGPAERGDKDADARSGTSPRPWLLTARCRRSSGPSLPSVDSAAQRRLSEGVTDRGEALSQQGLGPGIRARRRAGSSPGQDAGPPGAAATAPVPCARCPWAAPRSPRDPPPRHGPTKHEGSSGVATVPLERGRDGALQPIRPQCSGLQRPPGSLSVPAPAPPLS